MALTEQHDPMADGLAASLESFDPELASLVLDELRAANEIDNVLTKVRQAKVAEATDRIEWAAIDGIGEATMRLDPFAYHYWGKRLGYDCWKDAKFKREFLRDNPEARIRRRRQRKPMVTVPHLHHYSPPRQNAAKQPTASHPARHQPAAPTTARTTPSIVSRQAAATATSGAAPISPIILP